MAINKHVSLAFWVVAACGVGWAGATWWGQREAGSSQLDVANVGATKSKAEMTAFAISKTGALYKPYVPIGKAGDEPNPKTTLTNVTEDAALQFPEEQTTRRQQTFALPLDLPDSALQIPDPANAEALIDKLRNTVPEAGVHENLPPHTPVDRSTDPHAAISLGNVTTGSLIQGKPLPQDSFGLRILPKTITRGYYYGTDGLITAVKNAAAQVAEKYPGSVLWVGNLSRHRL